MHWDSLKIFFVKNKYIFYWQPVDPNNYNPYKLLLTYLWPLAAAINGIIVNKNQL